MAWYDKINGTTQPSGNSPQQSGQVGSWANSINQTMQLQQRIQAANNTPGLAFRTAQKRASLFPSKLPPKASVGSVFKDPKTKQSFEFTQSGWKLKQATESFPKESIVKMPNGKATEEKPGFNISMKDVVEGIKKSLGDTINRAKSPTERPKLIEETKKGAIEFGKEALRAFPRAVATTAVTLNKPLGGKGELTPGEIKGTDYNKTAFAKAEKFLLGDKPIYDIKRTGEESLRGFGGNEALAKKYGVLAGVAFTGLDLIPGIPKKKIAESIAKETSETVIKNTLKKSIKNISDDVAEAMAKNLSPINDVKEVEKHIDFFTRVDRTKLTGKALNTSSEDILAGRQASLTRKTFTAPSSEDKGFEFLNRNYDYLKERYRTDHKGGLLNADEVREYFRPVGYNRVNSAAFHEASSKLTTEIFKDDVASLKPGDRYLFTAGSSGAGKTRAIKSFPTIKAGIKAGLDGNFSSESALKKLDDVVKTGAQPGIVFIHRNPEAAWVDGVVKRAVNPENGRVVPLDVFVDNLVDSKDTVLKAVDKYGSKVALMVVDNNHGAGGARYVDDGLSFMKKLEYNKSNVKEQLIQATVQKIKDGTITSEATAKALLGPDWERISSQLKQEHFQGFKELGVTPREIDRSAITQAFQDGANKLPAETGATTARKVSETLPTEGISKTDSSFGAAKSGIESPSNKVYSGKTTLTQAIEKTAKSNNEPPGVVKKVTSAIKETRTKLIEYVQNEQERVRQLVNRKDVKIDDVSDPYLKATLYSGRVAERVTQGKEEAAAIIKDAKKLAGEAKTDLKTIRQQVNDYLHFRHAPERNAALGEKAAGITTEEAQAGLAALEASPHGAKIKALADKAQELNNKTLEVLKESGVISDELYDTLRNKYQNHVPLQRFFEETDDVGGALSGRGFDVKATGILKAKGSEREVDDILKNIVSNYEQAVIRSEKNIVDQATLAFVRNNKDTFGNLFQEIRPKAIGESFSGGILREKTQDPTILQMFEKGKPVWIKIQDPNLAIALRGVGREKLGGLMNAVAAFTRFYSGLATRFNPEFALPNKIRDLQETAVYLASQKGVGFAGATKTVIRDTFQQNTKAILDYMRGADTTGAKLYKEMKELGGTTGGMGLSTRAEVAMNLQKLEKLANSKTAKIGDNLVRYVDNWNTIFEDSTRLSVYRQALAQGLSKERAAFLAKEASINFNRMGKGGPVINALWMFSNASIQGSTKMIRALKNPKVLAATTLAVGGSVAVINQWNDQVDPDWRDKVTKWDRLNGLPIILPNPEGEGVKYVTIPVSWGIKPIKVMMDYAYDAVSGQEFKPKDFINTTLTSVIEGYNPVGGTDLWSALFPTLLDVPAEIMRNQSWSGSKIKPDPMPGNPQPEDIRYFSSLKDTKTGQTAVSISELLQSKLGIAVSPADIKYAYDGYVGGAGRAVSKTVNTITGALGGRPAPIDEYPMVSRFYRSRNQEELGQGARGQTEEIKKSLENQSRERFKLGEEAEKLSEEITKLPKEEKAAKAKEIYEKNPELYKKLKDIKEEKSLGLTYQDRLVKRLGVENYERAKYIRGKADEFGNKEERRAYLQDLIKKKVITEEVYNQMKYLKNNPR